MTSSIPAINEQLDSSITHQSIIAIVFFAVTIYGLHLPFFFTNISLFAKFPTLLTLLFLGVFVFYLAIVWSCAHKPHQMINKSRLSRQSYVLSNISFSVPILLPWIFLSLISDLVEVLPFELPKRFLSTPEGIFIYFLVFLFAIAIIAPVLIQKFWQCKPLETGYSRHRIEALCNKAGLKYAEILKWPIFGGTVITAGVMGLIKKFRYILVTPALLRYLEPEELDAVIAHEIGHVKKKHLLFYLLFFISSIPALYFSQIASDILIKTAIIDIEFISNLVDLTGLKWITVYSIIDTLSVIVFFYIFFRYVFGYFMRNFERQADIFVYSLSDTATPLVSTLEKIAITTGQSPEKPNWHHFSIRERIDYLKKCEADKTWICRHNQKIKKSISAYLISVILIIVIGYQTDFSETRKTVNAQIYEKILLSEVEKISDNPDLFHVLGDLYYSVNNFTETIKAYEKSLSLKPDDPEVLNNLAWLYATCENKQFRNPEKALKLAQKSAGLKKSSHILDTLAESYYINGYVNEAVKAEREALEKAKDNQSYYEEQLGKFIRAVN